MLCYYGDDMEEYRRLCRLEDNIKMMCQWVEIAQNIYSCSDFMLTAPRIHTFNPSQGVDSVTPHFEVSSRKGNNFCIVCCIDASDHLFIAILQFQMFCFKANHTLLKTSPPILMKLQKSSQYYLEIPQH